MKKFLLLVALFVTSNSFSQTYTFTNAGVTGRMGPLQGDIDVAYSGTNLDGNVTISTQGIQKWVVPFSGIYNIQAIGAAGGNTSYSTTIYGGLGYDLSGDFQLYYGDTIYIAVGQMGESDAVGGGGGGTFVSLATAPLIVAGGGGGASSDMAGVNAVITNNGTMDSQNIINGGTLGSGGDACVLGENNGGGGAGYYTDGANAQPSSGINWGRGGMSFANGLIGGEPGRLDGACTADPYGGFGGGGSATCNTVGGGGGGGYSGGAGGIHISNCGTPLRSGGGGGGSFNAGTNGIDNGAISSSNGSVSITVVCIPTSITPDILTLTDGFGECVYDGASAPTATSSCGTTINGAPDIALPITSYGTYNVTWTYDAGSGITATQTQTIVVGDSSAPAPDSLALLNINGVCQIDSLIAPTATDSCVGQIVGTTTTVFPITTQGSTTVTWNFDDGNGNISTQTQTVTLNDTIAPIADSLSLPDLSGCIEVNPIAPMGTDDCVGIITATPDVSLPITAGGLTVVTWTFTDNNGNTATLTQNVTVEAVDVSIAQTGGTLTVGQTGATYQWIDCDNGNAAISGETSQTFTATALTGNYAAVVTFNNCTDTSACTLVDYTSLKDLNQEVISIYPNPSAGEFKISAANEILAIEIYDMLGRPVNTVINLTAGTIDGSQLDAGKYHVRIETTFGTSIKEIVRIP